MAIVVRNGIIESNPNPRWEDHSVMVNFIGNGHNDQSSNHAVCICFSFHRNKTKTLLSEEPS